MGLLKPPLGGIDKSTHLLGAMPSASHLIEKFPGDGEVLEVFFFRAEFRRMGNQTATGAPGGVLYVQHFVVQDILDDRLRNARTIHAAV